MKKFILSLFILLSTQAFALSVKDLQAGDVLLISFNCYECRVIESETNSIFSHSGVVIKDANGELKIGQSLGKVALYTYAEFIRPVTPGTSVHVYRPREFETFSSEERSRVEKSMLDVFNRVYKNIPFDTQYMWNNVNADGVELLYCSEFIAKFLDHFLTQKTIPLPLTYDKNLAFWTKYFQGHVPEGELGNSPAAFSRDARFEFIGKI
jgi:hypothetical protein